MQRHIGRDHPDRRLVGPQEFKNRGTAWVALGLLTLLAAAYIYGAFPGARGQVGALIFTVLALSKIGWGVTLWNRGKR